MPHFSAIFGEVGIFLFFEASQVELSSHRLLFRFLTRSASP